MRKVTFAATQFACLGANNLARAKAWCASAAAKGAQVILIQELFETPYFCQDQKAEHFALAKPFEGNPLIAADGQRWRRNWASCCRSAFSKAPARRISIRWRWSMRTAKCWAFIASPTSPMAPAIRRNSISRPAIPASRSGRRSSALSACGICWDQWFPEAARAMALMGAEALLYPTAIGSEPPPAPPVDSRDHWRRVMQGHAAANVMPLIASNRVGTEKGLHRDHILWLVVHRRPDRRAGEGHGPRQRRRDHRDLRPGRHRRAAPELGPVPRPAARSLRRAASRQTSRKNYFPEPTAFVHRFAAEFGADLVHGAFGCGALVGQGIDQVGRVGFDGRTEIGNPHAQQAETRAVGFALQRRLRHAEDAVGQLGGRIQRSAAGAKPEIARS